MSWQQSKRQKFWKRGHRSARKTPGLKENPGPSRGSTLSRLEVHRAVGQVVFAANVADLLGLHRLQLGAVRDAMAQAATEGTAPLTCNGRDGVKARTAECQTRTAAPTPEQRGYTSISRLELRGPCVSLGSHLQCPAWSHPHSAALGAQVAPSASPPGAEPSGPLALTRLGAETQVRQSHPACSEHPLATAQLPPAAPSPVLFLTTGLVDEGGGNASVA